MNYNEWVIRHPKAARELSEVMGMTPTSDPYIHDGSESSVQQQVRFKAASHGVCAWRNNVGATPSRCSECGATRPPVRYGLANDSSKLNKRIKSSDLILAIPRVITPEMIGGTIAQFGAVECKRPGWSYKGTDAEVAQLAWLTLIKKLGGFATFSTGDLKL